MNSERELHLDLRYVSLALIALFKVQKKVQFIVHYQTLSNVAF